MNGMGSLELPYLSCEITRHGKRVYYVRVKGRRTRLPDPNAPNFMDRYNAAVRAPQVRREPIAKPGTLEWLIRLYLESQTYARLAPATRATRRRILDHVREKAGESTIASITQQVIVKGRDRRTAPEAANAFLKTMSAVFSWAVEHGHAKDNPVRGVARIKSRSTGHHTWTEDEIARFRRTYALGTTERTIMEIMLGTGLRISDASILGRQHVKDGLVTIATKKTGVTVTLPLVADLRAALDHVPKNQMLFVPTRSGVARSEKSASQWFAGKCDSADVPGTAHGLRKAAATRLADAGASEHQLMAVMGWKDPKEAAVYTREANRKRLAKSALDLISGQAENETVSPTAAGAVAPGKSAS